MSAGGVPVERATARCGWGPHVLVHIGDAVQGRYPVEVSVVDDAGAVRVLPGATIDDATLDDLPDLTTDDTSAGATELAEAGDVLFGLLGAGLAEATGAGPLRLLLDVRPAGLRVLPWELLRDPDMGTFPFRDRDTPAARVYPKVVRTADVAVPAHVLVVVGDPLDDQLGADDEIDAIFEGLREAPCCWQVDVLRGPTMERFDEVYRDVEPDVLHVIGHGLDSDEGPAVDVQAGGAQVWQLTADFLTGVLDRMPRMAVLSACRSGAQPSQDASRLARGLSDALLRAGTHAVIAMQGDVVPASGARFTRALYAALARGDPVDTAAAEGRAAVKLAGRRHGARDWALPVLMLAADPGGLLRQPRRWSPEAVIGRHRELAPVPLMVDRTQARRWLQKRIRAAPDGDTGAGLLFVAGPERAGKSLLVLSALVAHAIRGAPVVYHSLEGHGCVSTADLVSRLIDAAGRWLAAADLPQDVLSALKQTSTEPGVAVPLLPPTGRADEPRTAAANAYQRLLGPLRALAGATDGPPLVLVLDGVGGIDERDAFVRGLLEPAALGSLGKVWLIVVDELNTLRDLAGERAEWLGEDRLLEVETFPPEDVVALVREYLARGRPAKVADPERWRAGWERMVGWAQDEPNFEPELFVSAAQLFMRGTGFPIGGQR